MYGKVYGSIVHTTLDYNMKKERLWPEVHVDIKFLKREDIINKILRVDEVTFNVNFEHPVLGEVVEVYQLVNRDLLCLKSVYPVDMQDSSEDEWDIVKDYYNNFLLDGEETYLEYFNEEIGYFLLSRNVRELDKFF
jgi:hypothetical protein